MSPLSLFETIKSADVNEHILLAKLAVFQAYRLVSVKRSHQWYA